MIGAKDYEDLSREFSFLRNNLWAEVYAGDAEDTVLRSYDRIDKDLLVIGHSNALERLFSKNSKKILESYESLHESGLVDKFDRNCISFEIKHHNPEKIQDNCKEGVCGGEFGIEFCDDPHVYQELDENNDLVFRDESWYWTLEMYVSGVRGDKIYIDNYDSRRCDLDLYGYFPVRYQGLPHNQEISRSSKGSSRVTDIDWGDDSLWNIETVGTKLEEYKKIGRHLRHSLKLFHRLPNSSKQYDEQLDLKIKSEIKEQEKKKEEEIERERIFSDSLRRKEARKSSALNAKWFLFTILLFVLMSALDFIYGDSMAKTLLLVIFVTIITLFNETDF